MDGYLRQSTAAQVRWIGPFVDDTDFKTAETGLTVANTDIKVSKNGGASANKNSGGGTHDVNGFYAVTWDATDTATVGELKYSVKVAGALQVFGSYVVLEEAVYDALFAAAAPGYVANAPVNVAQLSGDTTAADNAEAFFDGTGYAGTNNVIPTVTTVTNGVAVAMGGIATTSFAAGAIDAAAIAAGAITSSEAPNLDAAISTRATPAQVNTEVLDVLNVDTFAEPGQEVPPATTTLVKKIGYIYKFLRNRITQTATTLSVYADDATTVDQKATVSDNGTTYDRGEIASGP